MNCPHCQQILPFDYQAAYCPFCGNDFPKDFPIEQTAVRPPESTPSEKWMHTLAFWLVFFGSPVLGLIVGMMGMEWPRWLLFPLVGATISVYILARDFNKKFGGVFLGTVLITLAVLAVYVGVIFVGLQVIFRSFARP